MLKIFFTSLAVLLLSACASTPLTATYDFDIVKESMKPVTRPVLFSLPDSHPVALAIKENDSIAPLVNGKIYVSDVRAVQRQGYSSFSRDGTIELGTNYYLDGALLAASLKLALNELLGEQGALATSPEEADMLLDIAIVDAEKGINTGRLEMKFEVKSAPSSGHWNKQIEFEIPRIKRKPDCYDCSAFADRDNRIKLDSEYSATTSLEKQVSERFGELFGLLLTDFSLADEYQQESFKVAGLGLNTIAQGGFANAADQHRQAAKAEQLRNQALEQQRQARLNQLSAFIREHPELNTVYTNLLNQGATCAATNKLSSAISDFSCGGMTEGRLREYYKAPECEAIQGQAAPMIRQDSDRICNSYRTGKQEFNKAFGQQSEWVDALFYRDVKNLGQAPSLQGYESILTSLRQVNETAKSDHEQSIDDNYRNNMNNIADKMRSVGSNSTAADRIIQQSVYNTQATLARMAAAQATQMPKVDTRALNQRMALTEPLQQGKPTVVKPSADELFDDAEARCKIAKGELTMNLQTKNYDCLIIKNGANSVTGVPQPTKVGVRTSATVGASTGTGKMNGLDQLASSVGEKTLASNDQSKTSEEMIQVQEARAVCFKWDKKGETQAWRCVGPVQDTILPDDTEEKALEYSGCKQPRKVIHNVRAAYKNFNTVDYTHYGYACGKPAMESDLNVDRVTQVKWPGDAYFIQYLCPKHAINRKKSCVAQ